MGYRYNSEVEIISKKGIAGQERYRAITSAYERFL